MILETERLYLREMRQSDFDSLCMMLQDIEVMYAYEHSFSDEEVQEWLDRQIDRYREHGFGLWAVIRKENGEMIGQCGLTMQKAGEEVYSIIRDNNIASQEVAKRNGMTVKGSFMKYYYGMEMPHLIFSATRMSY